MYRQSSTITKVNVMRNIQLTLSTEDLEVINDALVERGECQELIGVFSLLESQGKPVNLQVSEDELEVDLSDLSGLLDDLDLVPTGEKPFVEGIDAEVVEPQKIMVQDSTPVAIVIEPEPEPEPVVEVKPNKVIAGWDTRVPRPTIDPAILAQQEAERLAKEAVKNPAPQPEIKPERKSGFNPVPNDGPGKVEDAQPETAAPKSLKSGEPEVAPSNVPDKPTPPPPAPPKREPNFDDDEACQGCGGFLSSNPHSDPNMNCDCGADPYTEDGYSEAVDEKIIVKGSEEMRESMAPPEPEVTPAQEVSQGAWTTKLNPADDPNIWRT
jgi:hypothetical protein